MIFYKREFFVCDLYGFLDGEDQSEYCFIIKTIIYEVFQI